MTNKEKLESYLPSFLLDETNNGKTVMISGAWGAGKTHFWQNEIEPKLSKELKEKACVYVSLYGKENIEILKNEILFKSYESIKKVNKVKERAISAFGVGSKIFSFSAFGIKVDSKEIVNKLEEYDESKKIEEAESFIQDGGVICLDDFERKSNNIDLNDLFGFISQLAIEMSCKIVIILNSDVFTGKEGEVFRNVKEKTVNKFLYFDPTIKELFKSIYEDKKYNKLENYKDDILKAIHETKELNARIYIQVLDNCLEWLKAEKRLNKKIIRVLVLSTINFILNHLVFKAKIIEFDENYAKNLLSNSFSDLNSGNAISSNYQPKIVKKLSADIINKDFSDYPNIIDFISGDYFVEDIIEQTIINIQKDEKEKHKDIYIKYVQNNKNVIRSLNFYYFFRLHLGENEIEETIFNEINHFIASGILI